MHWIVTDNIYTETWRRLLEFANLELTIEELERRHGAATTKSIKQNYIKQANQARVCVLQAKEYFDAARASSLFTSPNHAYYGAIALSSLILLIVGDGTKSLDYLRLDNRNNHHGLDLTTGCSAHTAAKGFTLLQQTQVQILPHGHFGNWYRTLPPRGIVYAHTHINRGQIASANYSPVGGYDVPSYQSLSKKKFSILELFKYLPDLDNELRRFGVNAPRSRTTHNIFTEPDGHTRHTWFIHGCETNHDLELLLEKFSVISYYAESLTLKEIDSNHNQAVVELVYKTPLEIGFTWPTCRETLNHETISYADANETHEIVDLYLIAYQLSMLSRYYPDIWVGFIESHCKGAKLVERATELLIKKFPILALSMLSPQEIVISTHRPPWKQK